MTIPQLSSARIRPPRWLRGAACGIVVVLLAGPGQAQDAAADVYFTANGGSGSAAGAAAEGEEAVAVGEASNAAGSAAMAIGAGSLAEGEAVTAIGRNAVARQRDATAIGSGSLAAARDALAVGSRARAELTGTSVFGADAIAAEVYATALGMGSNAGGQQALAVGFLSIAGANGATALGGYSASTGLLSSAIGYATRVESQAGTALGYRATVAGEGGLAMGASATVAAAGAVAIGAGAKAEEADVVSFGSGDGVDGAATRRLTRLAAGRLASDSTDAINGGQLLPLLEAQARTFGGGATLDAQGTLQLPAYVIQGSSYHTVGDALSALDGRVGELAAGTARVAAQAGQTARQVEQIQADQAAQPALVTTTDNGDTAVGLRARAEAGNALAAGDSAVATAQAATALGQGAQATATGAVALGQGALADRPDAVSIGRSGAERQLTHVAAGSRDTDAVNKAQLEGGIAAANRYTDQRHSALADSFTLYRGTVDERFRRQDERIDRQGAMNAAMLNMATSTAGLRTQNRLGVGAGFQSGRAALSLGYQRAISERATVTLGGAFSGDDASLGVGAGFGW